MKDFSIENINGEVKIIRQYKGSTSKRNQTIKQSIRVQCFDAEQVERIMKFQHIENERRILRESNSSSLLERIAKGIKKGANKLKIFFL